MLPFALAEKKVVVACIDPNDRVGLEALGKYLGMPILARRADPEALKKCCSAFIPIPRALPIRPPTAAEASRGPENDDDAIGLADEIMRFAVLRQASDIHIEPRRAGVRIRLRCDGQLEELRRLPTSRQTGLISRLKVCVGWTSPKNAAPRMARSPGPGAPGPERPSVDIRVATVPVKYGERMTLRLLNLNTGTLTLEKLGMSAQRSQRLRPRD